MEDRQYEGRSSNISLTVGSSAHRPDNGLVKCASTIGGHPSAL